MFVCRLYLVKYSTLATMESSAVHDLIVIRHAQSNFNKGFLDFNTKNLPWQDCIVDEQFNKAVSYSQQYFDCSITEAGRAQCRKAREQLADEHVDVVLVSPYLRTLQTCQEIFGGKGIKVEVHPIIAEVFRYSCDISNHMAEKVKEFSEFDFSFMKDHSELWFLEHLSEHIKKTCNQHLEVEGSTVQQRQLKLLELLQSRVIYESPQELRERTWKIKELLTEYRKKYKKIAIVSHYNTISTLLATGFNELGEVKNHEDIENASPYYVSIDKLLEVK